MKRFPELFKYPVCRDNYYLIRFYQKRVLSSIDAISHMYAIKSRYNNPNNIEEYDKLIDELFEYKNNAKRKLGIILARCEYNNRSKDMIIKECEEEFHNGLKTV